MKSSPHDTLWQPLPTSAGRFRPWLRDHGSLTLRIEQRAPGMQVKVLAQGARRLYRDERFMARGHLHALALTRDVLLISRGLPVVYAHSVIQPGDFGAACRLVRRMGSRPLGAALFADPRIRRFALRQHKIGRSHPLHRAARAHISLPSTLWARRSVFITGNSPILVTEVFLPGVLAL